MRDDVGDAYRRAVLSDARGAFNIAGEPVLDAGRNRGCPRDARTLTAARSESLRGAARATLARTSAADLARLDRPRSRRAGARHRSRSLGARLGADPERRRHPAGGRGGNARACRPGDAAARVVAQALTSARRGHTSADERAAANRSAPPLRGGRPRLDAARVEEAFATFADRVHELESVADELRAELQALRSQRRDFEPAPARYESEEWPVDGPNANGTAPPPDWVSSVPAPLTRPIAIPRLVLEAIFLLLVALFAGLADLSTTAIAVVMAAAWALVVVAEWAAAARRARWHLEAVATPVADPADDNTGPWSMPVVEATVVEAPDDSESHTVVTKLPPQPESTQPESTPGRALPSRETVRVPRPTSRCSPELCADEPALAHVRAADGRRAMTDEPMTDEAAVDPETAPAEPDTAESVLAAAEGDTGSHPAIPQALEDEPEPQQKRRFGLFRRKQRADEHGSRDTGPLGALTRRSSLAPACAGGGRARGHAVRRAAALAGSDLRAEADARLRRRALRVRATATDCARLRAGRAALRDPGEGGARRGRTRLRRARACSRATSGLRSGLRGAARRSSSLRKDRCTGSSCAARASSRDAGS